MLSQQELSAARLDGLLVEVGEGYMPADLPEDAGARAAAVMSVLSPGYAMSGPTAAWVHGAGGAPPQRHHIHRAVDYRPRVEPRRDVVVHEGQVMPNDLIFIGATPVTTPLRTLTDLVLTANRYEECASWARSMAVAMPALVSQAQALLAGRTRMPGKRAALATVAELLDEITHGEMGQDVTRYTS